MLWIARLKIWPRLASSLLGLGLLLDLVQPTVSRGGQAPKRIDENAVRPQVVFSSRNDLSPALRSIQPQLVHQSAFRDVPNFPLPKGLRGGETASPDASILQDQPLLPGVEAPATIPEPLQSFDGVTNLFGGWPPDTQGDIGPGHYVQWINLHFAIWQIDRQTNTATKIYGPVPGNTLFTGFNGACETTNDGDPITLYDPFADRWFMSQFALPNWPAGPFYQCVAVSQTGDPSGAWYRYEFPMPVNKMNDYPKFGVWPDAYYMTVNQYNAGSMSAGGAGVAALERSAMLNGDPARMVYIDLYNVNSNFGGMLPADFDGFIPPPVDAPGYFAEWDDGAWLPPQDAIRLWEFHVDWDNPSNSTFGLDGNPNQLIPTANVDPNMCGMSRSCIPQPGTSTRVDAISDRLMYRLQYRNFGDHETLVSNHTVDVDGSDHAGIHWLELRQSAGSWSLLQEGVYAPDSQHRWMGSAAMDANGDIALGYSVSSSTVHPSVRYTGRLVGDPLGLLPQGEASLIEGSGSQTGSTRWGDYSMMGLDPLDDCTFWYTQEYVAVSGSNTWRTRIGAFRFPGCEVGPRGQLEGTVTESGGILPIDGAEVRASLNVTRTFTTLTHPDGLYGMQLPTGTYTVTASAFGYLPSVVPGVEVFSGTVTTQNMELDLAPSATISGTVRDANTGWPLYARLDIGDAPVDPLWSDPVTGFYSLTLPQGSIYTFEVQAFSPGYLSQQIQVGPLIGDLNLPIDLQVDASACLAPGYDVSFTQIYSSNFEADDGGLTAGGTLSWEWGAPTSGPGNAHSGAKVWATNLNGNYSNYEDGYLNLPSIDLSSFVGQTPVIEWWQWLQSELDFDFASLEVSKDGGGAWDVVYGPVDGSVDLSWSQHTLILNPSYAVSDLRVRFHFTSDYIVNYPGWYVDDLRVGVGDCVPQAGGLVVGNVYDANTGQGLNSATIVNQGGNETTSQDTLDDPAQADGFYTLFSPSGGQVFTATRQGGYQGVSATPSVIPNSTIRQDFHLPAGYLSYEPASMEVVMELGSALTLPLTVTNLGGVTAAFETTELNRGQILLGPFESPAFVNKPFKSNLPTTQGLGLPDLPEAAPLAAGDVIEWWSPTGVTGAWGVAYDNVDDTVWLNSPVPAWNGDDTLYEFSPQGDYTGRSYLNDMPHSVGPADMAVQWASGKLWIMNINTGVANCIYEIDPDSGYTGASICPGGGSGFTSSQRGLAYDPETDTWFAGGWNDQMVYQFDPQGDILNSVYTGLPISGLAYNPESQHLFTMVNASSTLIYVLDVADGYKVIGQFAISQGFNAYAGAGLEIACDGSLWAVDQNSGSVYHIDSGETASLCNQDVPWLRSQPTSATIATFGQQLMDVTFDGGVPEISQPGIYRAQLRFDDDTPYSLPNLPLTMTLTAPPTWGKLSGVVTGLGYCDADPSPLHNADVTIESSAGLTWTQKTDANGEYQRWLEEAGSPYTITVETNEYSIGLFSDLIVTGGISVTRNFDLHWLRPCIRITPPALSASLKQGRSSVLTLTLDNAGYAISDFEFLEAPLDQPVASSRPSLLQPAAPGFEEARAAPDVAGYSSVVYPAPDATLLLDEGFEGGSVPPAGWMQVSSNNKTWSIASSAPHSGAYYAHVLFDYNQDEWLLSPELILTEGQISFWSYGSLYWCRDTYDNCDLNIWLVHGDPGGGDDVYIGKADGNWMGNWIWSQSSFNLTPYLGGGPVRIGFQYLGNDGAEIALDDILLVGVEGGDVPWMAVSPVTGTLSAQDSQAISVTLDAAAPDAYEPGDYHALLKLISDDPINDSLSVPVTLTVIPLEYGVAVSGDLTGHDIPGETVRYTLTLTNTSEGPSDAFDLSLGAHDWTSNLDTYSLGPLAQGESAQFEVSVKIPTDASGSEFDALVLTATSQGDPSKMDTAILTTTADIPSADLEIYQSVSADPIAVGSPVTYTLVVTNHGPTKAIRVNLLDVLPFGAAYLGDDAGCDFTSPVLVCGLGKLLVGETRVVHIVVLPFLPSTLVNQALVVADSDDPDPGNNWYTLHTQSQGYVMFFPLIYR